MFADTHSASRSTPSLANAYRQVGTETGVSGATPHKLVQMLFDGFQEAVAQARGALRNRLIEAKGRAIGRAMRIVDEGLHAGLNMSAGGKLAADLDALYTYVSLRLTHANLHNDESALDECVALIEPLRSAWAAIGPQVNGVQQ
ncbi:MAG: flagellar export chaperone FliS [Rhizobacter sp.]